MIKQLFLAGMLTMAQPSMALDPTNPNYENIKLENNGSSNSAFIVNSTVSSTQQILGVTSAKQYTKTTNGTQIDATLRSQQFTWFCNAEEYQSRTGSQLARYSNINNNNHFLARYENQNDEYTSKYQYTSNGTTWYSWTSIAIKVNTNGILTHPTIYYHPYYDISTYYESNRSELTFKKEVWMTNQSSAAEIMNIGETGTEENRRLIDYSTKFNNGEYTYNYSYSYEETSAYYMDDLNGEENKIDIYTTKNTPTYIYIKLSVYNKTHPGSESGNNNKYFSDISYVDDIELNGYCPLNISTEKGIGLETYYVIDQEFNQEVIDVPSVMFTILGMPFIFISTAFNLTLFPGTPYAINFTNLFLAIIAILVFIMILKIIIKNKG